MTLEGEGGVFLCDPLRATIKKRSFCAQLDARPLCLDAVHTPQFHIQVTPVAVVTARDAIDSRLAINIECRSERSGPEQKRREKKRERPRWRYTVRVKNGKKYNFINQGINTLSILILKEC